MAKILVLPGRKTIWQVDDASSTTTYLTSSLKNVAKYIANVLGVKPEDVTVAGAAAAGFSLRRV